MKRYIFTTLALTVLTFFLAPNISAQSSLPCGNITAPVGWEGSFDPQEPLGTNPIVNCENPFGITDAGPSPDEFFIESNRILDNDVIEIPGPAIHDYDIRFDYSNNFISHQAILFKHEEANYRYVSMEPLAPTEVDYRKLANEFFTDQSDIENAVTRIMSPDPWAGLEYATEEFIKIDDFYTYVQNNLEPALPPLGLGTYTLVFKLTPVSSSWHQKLIKKLARLFIQVAYAATPGTYKITFTLKNPTPEPMGASSVLFLPGIQASRLYKVGLAGSEDEVWVPDGNQDVLQLAMDDSGVSQNQVYTRNILEKLPIFQGTVYESFINSMDDLVGREVIHSWLSFAYDWRYSVNDIAQNGTQYENEIRDIIEEIEYLAEDSFSDKVTIIGHSNGGLLAKVVMKRLEQEGKANLVDKIVLLASPQLGTPKAIGTILHGYDQEKLGGWVIDDMVAREVIQNMPGAYGLVTSQEYFDTVTDSVIRFENSTATQLFRTAYGDSIDSAEELKRFMVGSSDNRPQAQTTDDILRANSTLLDSALNLHDTALDTWTAPAGVKVIEVVGTGLDTVSGFEYRTFQERVCSVLGVLSCEIKYLYKPVPIISQKGDKTVVVDSAEGYDGTKEKYYIDLEASDIKGEEFQVEHYNISENPSIQKLVTNILLATTSDIEFISTEPNQTNTNRVLLGVHSPVTLEVVDSNGKRVGKKLVGDLTTKEEEVPGSSYFEIGSSKYVIVPDDGNYTIKLEGTAEGGLTFSLDRLNGPNQIPQISVSVATITASTTIGIKYTNSDLTNLEIDTNGDTIIDTILTPAGVDVTPKITYKTLRDKINSLTLSTIRKLPVLILVDAAELLDKKSVLNPKLTTAELYTLHKLESLLVIYQQKGLITLSNLNELNLIINKLK